MVLFLTMIVVPLIYSGYLSFFKTKLIGGTSFVGAENYLRALTDPSFLTGVGRMVLFLLVQVPLMLVLSLFAALALDSGMMRLAKFARLAIFVPYAVPSVIATLMWGYIYGPDFGPIAQIGEAIGLGAPPFFSSTGIFFSIINIVNWEFVGYNMIIMYAALRSIPAELYEAARVDGASETRIATAIKIPSIRPAILLTVIFSVIGTFQLFNEPALMRNPRPDGDRYRLDAQPVRLQHRLRQPGRQLRRGPGVPARHRDHDHLLCRPAQHPTEGAAPMTSVLDTARAPRPRNSGRRPSTPRAPAGRAGCSLS